ncbi:MAG: PspC domain-containing protein [Chloroflexia bacterium]|nr:PspC domain-containing protein [Chloroflexia bacterium]
MKITENINLAGLIFTIDEDALLKLQNYLNAIERYFGAKDEREEIIADIESRIAELFQTQLNKSKEVISMLEVDQVIETLGMPEQIMGEEESSENQKEFYTTQKPHKLYRDPDNRVLGGVCTGLGAYLNIDPVILRVLFVIFAFIGFGGGLVYIALWIILPPAISVQDKFEMKGYKVNKKTF